MPDAPSRGMPIDSPENALIFSVFHFLLAGLSVAASAWLLWVQERHLLAVGIFSLLGFGLLSLHYLATSHLLFFELANHANFFTSLFSLPVFRYLYLAGFGLIGTAAVFWGSLRVPLALLVVSEILETRWLIGSMSLAMLGLFGSAFVIERRCESIYFRFFVRLNTVFMIIALVLILITAHSERSQHLEYAALSMEDLAEYLRGHIIYFFQGGVFPANIVANQEIQQRIISEFGRVPDLRSVRVGVRDHSIEMAIRDDGVIDFTEYNTPLVAMPQEGRYNRRRKLLNVVSMPVHLNNEPVGLIEMDQTLLRINSRLARQIQVVFMAFTISVFAAFLISGLIIREANRTIQEQCSQLREVESQLMQSSKLASIGRLADGIAHEINNPAGIILARADYLAAIAGDDGTLAKIGSDIDAIRRQARRISSIVSDLLMFSRPSRLALQPANIVEVTRRAIQSLQPVIDAKGICVCTPLPATPVEIPADSDRLEQVVINMVQNAIDAMPRGGCIDVSLTQDRTGVTLRLRDTGEGILPENLHKIFDPFFTTKGNRGTGLGLSISYGIIRDHGGKISVESVPGHGAVFSVFLPRQRAST